MLFGNFLAITIVTIISAFAASAIIEANHEKKYRKVGIALLAVTIVCGVIMIIASFYFSPMCGITEKVYEEPGVVSTKGVALETFKNTQCYLIKEDGKYKYCRKDGLIDETDSEAEISQCEIRYGGKDPSLTVEETEKRWRIEWLFLYDEGVETTIKYKFTIPDEDSILVLGKDE